MLSRWQKFGKFSLVWVFCLAVINAAHARPLDEVLAAKNLRVIAYLDNKPFSYLDEKDEPRGIDVEIGQAIARELGVEAEIILRMPGETADDDVRVNVWQGPRTGGGVGDIVMHIPYDKEFRIRNTEAVIVNPYFVEQISVAYHPELIAPDFSFDAFKEKKKDKGKKAGEDQKIGVQLATVSDYFLMTYDKGALINNIAHHTKPHLGAEEFARKETVALMGVRSAIEGQFKDIGLKASFADPDMTGIVREKWIVAMAIHENSRDLGYAVGDVLTKLQESGALAKIFEKYGITYFSPGG